MQMRRGCPRLPRPASIDRSGTIWNKLSGGGGRGLGPAGHTEGKRQGGAARLTPRGRTRLPSPHLRQIYAKQIAVTETIMQRIIDYCKVALQQPRGQ